MASGLLQTDRNLAEGEIFIVSGGIQDCEFVTGLYRARSELDLSALSAEFLAGIPAEPDEYKAPELPEMLHGSFVDWSRLETGFVAYLIEGGHIEQIPVVNLALGSELRRPGDGKRHGLWATINESPVAAPDETRAAPGM